MGILVFVLLFKIIILLLKMFCEKFVLIIGSVLVLDCIEIVIVFMFVVFLLLVILSWKVSFWDLLVIGVVIVKVERFVFIFVIMLVLLVWD